MEKINLRKEKFDLADKFEKGVLKGAVLGKSQWQKEAPPIIIKNIKDTIERGNSPVKGSKRFQEYSPSYKRAILTGSVGRKYKNKKLRPVNLTLGGKLLKSLISRQIKNGFIIQFTNELAFIHSELGAGKSKVIRKIMPSDEESFKKSITIESDKIISKALKKHFSKLF